jgi:hypothetical protein
MKANGMAARIERLEKQRGSGLIVAILREGETEAEGRQRVIAENGLRDGPQLCIVMGTELDAVL